MHTHRTESGSPPRFPEAASHTVTRAALLELHGVEKWFVVRGWSPRRAAPPPLLATGRVRRGECVLLRGERCAATALLWCVAGLTTPDRGELRWLASDGRPAPPPRRAYVAAGWRGYDCWTPRDALEAAVPAGTPQRAADRWLSRVHRLCLVPECDSAPLAELGAARRWLAGVAAAVATRARWLLLEPPALGGDDRRLVRRVLLRLRVAGLTMLAVAPAGAAYMVPAHRALWLPAPALPHDARAARARWRVAELSASREVPSCTAGASVDPPPGAP